MKKIALLLTIFICAAFAAQAQRIDYLPGVAQSKLAPSAAPSMSRLSQLWYNTETGTLYAWDKLNRVWYRQNPDYYGEMGIENDTLTLAFAAVTPDTITGLTAGLLHGFALGVVDVHVLLDGVAVGV